MPKAAKVKFKFCLLMTGVLLLSGCQSASGVRGSTKTSTRQPPAPAQVGDVAVVDDYNDPLQQHLRARRMVNPADTSERHAYTRTIGEDEPPPPANDVVIPSHKPARGGAEPWKFWDKKDESPKAAPQRVAAVPERRPIEPISVPQAKPEFSASDFSAPAPAPVKASSGHANVLGVRIGQHPGKTRVVLDVSASTPFTYHMEESKNVLVIELPEAGWDAEAKKVFSNHPLLLAYLAKPTASGGTFLAIKMNKKAELVFKTTYPKSGASNYRIVFDVAAS